MQRVARGGLRLVPSYATIPSNVDLKRERCVRRRRALCTKVRRDQSLGSIVGVEAPVENPSIDRCVSFIEVSLAVVVGRRREMTSAAAHECCFDRDDHSLRRKAVCLQPLDRRDSRETKGIGRLRSITATGFGECAPEFGRHRRCVGSVARNNRWSLIRILHEIAHSHFRPRAHVCPPIRCGVPATRTTLPHPIVAEPWRGSGKSLSDVSL